MARPTKEGLVYFSKDVDFYDDFKIQDLMNEFGPVGVCIYDVILCMVYRSGYYIEIAPDKLALSIVRCIGNKWVKKDFVLQVIQYCADIGLLCNDLLSQFVLTSAGIQKRYALATVRNKVHKDKYWLLEKDLGSKNTFSVPKNEVSVTETPVFVTETPVNATESTQKKRKENKSKINTTTTIDSYKYTNMQPASGNVSSDVVVSSNDNLNKLSWVDSFEDAFARPLTQYELMKLSEAISEFGEEMIQFALETAINNNSIRMNYIDGILNNWRTEHIDSLEKAKLQSKRFRRERTFSQGQHGIRVAKLPADFEQNFNRNNNAASKSEAVDPNELKKLQSLMKKLSEPNDK